MPPRLTVVQGFAPPADDVRDLATKKLHSSGLDWPDAEAAGITAHSAQEVTAWNVGLQALPVLRFPYFNPFGQADELARAKPGWPDFIRWRYLRDPVPKPEKFHKYSQPQNSGVCAYFPRLPCVDWPALLKDFREPLLITEGELKSIKATKEGFPCVGLGGVYNFKHSKTGISLLPDLEGIIWPRREVYVCLDSDAATNPMVAQAGLELATELDYRGAVVKLIYLPTHPDYPDKKIGLDDYLVLFSADSLSALLRSAEFVSIASRLWRMNDEYAYWIGGDRNISIKDGALLKPEAFKRVVPERIPNALAYRDESNSKSKGHVPLATLWQSWPLRTFVKGIDCHPIHLPRSVFTDDQGRSYYNSWAGWNVQPKSGSIKPFSALMAHLFNDATPEDLTYALQWLAYPLQHPGTKLFTAMLIHGIEHGTGKSLLGYTMREIYGASFQEIKQKDIQGAVDFNEWAQNCLFALCDEVTGSDKREHSDSMKTQITRPDIRINGKYQPTYLIKDRINYLITSNRFAAVYMEDRDRRYFVNEVRGKPLPISFYTEYFKWLMNGGAAALFDYLLGLDLTGFNPNGPARVTSAKLRMADANRSDLEVWAKNLIESPDDYLKLGEATLARDFHSLRELKMIYAFYSGEEPSRVRSSFIGAALREAGAVQVHRGNPVHIAGEPLDRYYAIRNPDKWQSASLIQLQRHHADSSHSSRKKF